MYVIDWAQPVHSFETLESPSYLRSRSSAVTGGEVRKSPLQRRDRTCRIIESSESKQAWALIVEWLTNNADVWFLIYPLKTCGIAVYESALNGRTKPTAYDWETGWAFCSARKQAKQKIGMMLVQQSPHKEVNIRIVVERNEIVIFPSVWELSQMVLQWHATLLEFLSRYTAAVIWSVGSAKWRTLLNDPFVVPFSCVSQRIYQMTLFLTWVGSEAQAQKRPSDSSLILHFGGWSSVASGLG